MKGKIAIALFFALGVILAVVLLNSKSPPETESSPETSSKSDYSDAETLPGFSSRRKESEREINPSEFEPLHPAIDIEPVVMAEGQRVEDLTPEEIARIEEGQRQISLLIANQKQGRFEVRLQELVKGLHLEPSQEGQLRAHYDSLQNAILEGDLQAHGSLQRLLAGEGLDELLADVLTEEQLSQHQSASERKRVEAAEKEVATEMTHLNSLLTLDKEQIIQVQEALTANALNAGKEQLSGDNVEELTRMGEELRAQLSQTEPGANPLQALIQGRMEQARAEKLQQLEGILSAEQLEVYRQSLEQRTDHSQFQNVLDAVGKGGR